MKLKIDIESNPNNPNEGRAYAEMEGAPEHLVASIIAIMKQDQKMANIILAAGTAYMLDRRGLFGPNGIGASSEKLDPKSYDPNKGFDFNGGNSNENPPDDLDIDDLKF
jgi:hypothetical protein